MNNTEQINANKINDLLNKYSGKSADLMCGTDCQRKKKEEELQKKYADAQLVMDTAPTTYKKAKKEYLEFVKGTGYYNELIAKELENKAEEIAKLLVNKFNGEYDKVKGISSIYNELMSTGQNSKDLLEEYGNKTRVIKKKLLESKDDIITNDRKTYYEYNSLSTLRNWYIFYFRVFLLLEIVFIAYLFGYSQTQMDIYKKLVLAISILLYPFLTINLIRYLVQALTIAYTFIIKKMVYKGM